MQRTFVRLAVVVLAVAGSLAATLSAAPESDGPLIVPGKSIGQTALGAEMTAVYKKLGNPAVDDSAMGKTWAGWFASKGGGGQGAELDVRFSISEGQPGKTVAAIRAESPFFHTREGLSAQSSLADWWKAFPGLRYAYDNSDDDTAEVYADSPHGIAIEVHPTHGGTVWGTCQAVIVYAPGSDPENAGPPAIHSMRDALSQ